MTFIGGIGAAGDHRTPIASQLKNDVKPAVSGLKNAIESRHVI